MNVRAAIFTRWPEPGRCKTRLIPALGAEGAAALHKKLVEKTVETVRSSGVPFELWVTGAPVSDFQNWLGDLTIHQQAEGDLGARLLAAAAPYPVFFLGTDAPGLTPDLVQNAANVLAFGNYVIGPAADGGYWTLGLPQPADDLFSDMPWGTAQVFEITKERLLQRQRHFNVLPTLDDIDKPEDLSRCAALIP